MHADDGDALLGRILQERYRIDSYLAHGGMSTVYEACDLRLDRPVAVKVMNPQYATDPTFLKRFEREARAAARLDNPHVVGVYDQGRDDDVVFLVMELVDGGTLRDLIHQQGQLSVRVALSVLEPVLDALASAHTAGLVHRDIKPENVLISGRGEVKVADFGLVRAVTSTTMMTGDVILGTVAYLSPEQVESGMADERSDVYSAGVVGYEMLTGRAPFVGDNALSVAYQHVHGDIPPVADHAPGVPMAIAAVIDTATRRDSLARPANAGEFLRQLRGARQRTGLSLCPVPIPAPSQAPRPAAARRTQRATAIQPDGDAPAPLTTTRETVRRAAPSSSIPSSSTPSATMPDAGEAAYYRRRRRHRRWLVGIIAVALVVAAAAGGGIWLANRWTSAPATDRHTASDAAAAVRAAGLKPVMTTRFDDAVPSGEVAAMTPKAQARLRTGSTVTLVVSEGRPTVPTVAAGATLAVAQAALRAVTLHPVTDASSNVYDDVVPSGAVVTTEPTAGKTAPIGSDVLVVLSRGPEPQPIPDVAGKLPDDAQNKLLVDGFEVGPPISRFAADVAAGTIIGTEPAAGTDRPRGSAISLIVATSKTVPDVGGGSVQDVSTRLTDDGFTVAVGTPEFAPGIAGGDVVRLDPAPGTRVDPAHPAITVIGSNAVTVPKLSGMTIGQARSALAARGLETTARSLFGLDSASVTSQDPAPGTLVKPGSTVRLSAWL